MQRFDKGCFLSALMAGVTTFPMLKSTKGNNENEPKSCYTLSSNYERDAASASKSSTDCTMHLQELMTNLNLQRINGKFCDVEIIIDGTSIKAHKAVLSASSSYFEAMFSVGLKEQELSTVELHLISGPIFNVLIDFIYTGKINIVENNVQELLVAADMLQLSEAVSLCTTFLKEQLHSSNAVGIYRFSDSHHLIELKQAAMDFIQAHFPLILKEGEFCDLSKDQLIIFLSSEQLRVDSEYQVFQAALRWIERNLSERRCYIFEVFHYVRWPLLSVDLLDRDIQNTSDESIRVALASFRKDLATKKGNLVSLIVRPRLSAKKDIFVVGGSRRELISMWIRTFGFHLYNSVERFDTFKREWIKTAPMLFGRILPGVAALDGKIYVVGGEQDSGVLRSGECYDPQSDSWSEIASMVVPRCEFGLCALDDTLYAVGGWVGDYQIGDMCGSIERYYPDRNEWIIEGSLPEPMFSMGVVAFEGFIYIVGGCTRCKRHLQDFRRYNPMTGKWCTLPSMTVPRSQLGIAVLGRHLYVIGGTNRSQEVLQSVEKYSFDTKKWINVSEMNVGRTCPAVSVVDGLLYVMGGLQTHNVDFWKSQITITSVECYDPILDTWKECPTLPESRGEAGAVAI